jgi:hypothetical protein
MTRKILLYGFAFGSLMFLTTYIYFENQLYTALTQDFLVGKIIPIIIQMIGVGLVIASIKKSEGGYITMGRAGFSGLICSIVMGIVSSFFYFIYVKQKPEMLENAKQSYQERSKAFYEKNKKEITEKELEEKLTALDFYYTANQQTKLDLYRVLGVGLLAAGSFGLMLQKDPPEGPRIPAKTDA